MREPMFYVLLLEFTRECFASTEYKFQVATQLL